MQRQERRYKTSAGFAAHYLEAPVTAVIADGDDPLILAIAVSTALGTVSTLLLGSDARLVPPLRV